MSEEKKTRTITLTGRPPVRIQDDEWDIVAQARSSDWDNQYEFQANRRHSRGITVRSHVDDGRVIVSAFDEYRTVCDGERSFYLKAGALLPADADVPAAIRRVATEVEELGREAGEGLNVDGWNILAQEAISDLPPEDI